jgi:hypothetical protein
MSNSVTRTPVSAPTSAPISAARGPLDGERRVPASKTHNPPAMARDSFDLDTSNVRPVDAAAASAAPSPLLIVSGAKMMGSPEPVVAGGSVRLVFADDASPYGWSFNSVPKHEVHVHYRYGDGPWQATTMAPANANSNTGGRVIYGETSLGVPSAAKGKLEYYFEIKPQGGNGIPVTADRQPFSNFSTPIIPPSTDRIHFSAALNNPEGRPVRAGTTLTIDYDPKRMAELFPRTPESRTLPETEAHPFPTQAVAQRLWQVDAHVRFVGANDSTVSEAVYPVRTGRDDTNPNKPLVSVPAEAHRMEVWFTSRLDGEALQWPREYSAPTVMPTDSDFSTKFVFPVIP